jgi:hypothetical protein
MYTMPMDWLLVLTQQLRDVFYADVVAALEATHQGSGRRHAR